MLKGVPPRVLVGPGRSGRRYPGSATMALRANSPGGTSNAPGRRSAATETATRRSGERKRTASPWPACRQWGGTPIEKPSTAVDLAVPRLRDRRRLLGRDGGGRLGRRAVPRARPAARKGGQRRGRRARRLPGETPSRGSFLPSRSERRQAVLVAGRRRAPGPGSERTSRGPSAAPQVQIRRSLTIPPQPRWRSRTGRPAGAQVLVAPVEQLKTIGQRSRPFSVSRYSKRSRPLLVAAPARGCPPRRAARAATGGRCGRCPGCAGSRRSGGRRGRRRAG